MDPAPVVPAPALSLPAAGTLTFLFTDVEGSTPLWERHEATMREVAARHDTLLDGIISQHGGRRVKERGEGDSVFATFVDPADAVAAALAMNLAILAEPWPAETPIKVRMGLHTGIAQFREGDYYGTVVNRCARIRGLGHGGQILLSSATAAQVREVLPEGASLRSLGLHILKGLADPEEVFQLCHPDLPDEFPPLLSPQAPHHNLPATLTNLIGREHQLSEILALLGTERLVTLTGSGGVGKTRLALAVAAELIDQYPDGVWLVELAGLANPTLVPGAVAQVLGVREEPGRSLTAVLSATLQPKQLLLVLDNCEHLLAACADLVTSLAQTCPRLHILATSREGLGVAGEALYRVPSLLVPDPRHLPPLEDLAGYEAVRLFVTRAQMRGAHFSLTGQNAAVVAQICARLDGIPLAIELAASRVGALPVEAIAARLDDRFRLLTAGPRSALPRQQTLRAALDWSHELLSRPEQVLLRRLAVFAGGWTLEAAEEVCADGEVTRWDVLDLLSTLVNKSLLLLEEEEAAPRYRLLETVRAYGWERLAAAGEGELVRKRHLAWSVGLGEEAEPELTGPEEGAWLRRLETEHDNLRAALSWAREQGIVEASLRLAAALQPFWRTRGYLSEGRGWLEAALAAGGEAPAAVRAKALQMAGILAAMQIDYERAATLYDEALALSRELGDKRGIAQALQVIAYVAYQLTDYTRAIELCQEALALHRELGDKRGIANTLRDLGWCARVLRDVQLDVVALGEEALALYRELGDKRGIADALLMLGYNAYCEGDYGRSDALYQETLALRREVGDMVGVAEALISLAMVAHKQGDATQAETLLHEGLLVSRDTGFTQIEVTGLEITAWLALAGGQPRRAAQLAGAAVALAELRGATAVPDKLADHEQALQAMRAALGEEAFAAAWAKGRALSLDEAVALALESTGRRCGYPDQHHL